MTTIYLVTSGEYSDYGVDGVYSTHEKAMDHVRAIDGKYSRAQVEERELDAPFDRARAIWLVSIMGPRKGKADEKADADFRESIREGYQINAVWRSDIRMWGVGEDEPRWNVYVQAPDKEHALKIGQDLIAAFRAEQMMWESL